MKRSAASLVAFTLLACRQQEQQHVSEGELRVHVQDAESGASSMATIVAQREGTQLVRVADERLGELTMKLSPGRYRVSATRGVEWTKDAEVVDIVAGGSADVVLRPQHVIDPGTFVACDLRVDTREVDERLIAEAAAGFRLMVSAHDYRAALSRTDLAGQLFVVPPPAVYHFGGELETRVGSGLPRTYVDIGSHKQGYSGGPLDVAATLEALARGRGFVTNGPFIDFAIPDATLDDAGVNEGLDTTLSAAPKGIAKPGARMRARKQIVAHVRVRAPSWLDVSRVCIVAGTVTVFDRRIASTSDVVRFDADVSFALPDGARSLLVTAEGEHADEDVLEGAPLRPFAFTNPIWIDP